VLAYRCFFNIRGNCSVPPPREQSSRAPRFYIRGNVAVPPPREQSSRGPTPSRGSLRSPSRLERLVCWHARLTLGLGAAFAFLLVGCATVRPEERELLAEPSMQMATGSMAGAHEQHVLDNREGASGGGTARGGGCGCN
jgi:hypothetical protein